MMKIADVIHALEQIAPPSLQEEYDNSGLITGNAHWNCSGVLCTLDASSHYIQGVEKNHR
jgi:putative NIF3 family GTP cyclohydrolase 1 type 2